MEQTKDIEVLLLRKKMRSFLRKGLLINTSIRTAKDIDKFLGLV